jgi:hypothetical protein
VAELAMNMVQEFAETLGRFTSVCVDTALVSLPRASSNTLRKPGRRSSSSVGTREHFSCEFVSMCPAGGVMTRLV